MNDAKTAVVQEVLPASPAVSRTEVDRNMTTSNNFDFARLVAASLVLFSHAYTLFGLPEPLDVFTRNGASGGSVAVDVFFVLSGYLIAKSWDNDPNPVRYFLRRALRILPAFYVFLLVGTLIVGPALTTLPMADYFSAARVFGYLQQLDVFHVQGVLPGTFATNPLPGAFNGSLWTIRIEVACYLVLLALGIVGIFRSKWLVAGVAVALFELSLYAQFEKPTWNVLFMDAPSSLPLASLFFYASALYMWRKEIRLGPIFWPAAALLAYLLLKGTALQIASAILMPPAVLGLALQSTRYLKDAGRFGDFSYGIYIYAFPVQQIVVYYLFGEISLAQFNVVAFTITLACAWLSWKLIEKPALSFKPSRKATASREPLKGTVPA